MNNIEVDPRWHVGKEIPLAMITALVLQTFGVIWWAATLSTKVDNLKDQIVQMSANQITAVEARGLTSANATANLEQNRRIADLETRVRELEGIRK